MLDRGYVGTIPHALLPPRKLKVKKPQKTILVSSWGSRDYEAGAAQHSINNVEVYKSFSSSWILLRPLIAECIACV